LKAQFVLISKLEEMALLNVRDFENAGVEISIGVGDVSEEMGQSD
jgi:hypothetical protein